MRGAGAEAAGFSYDAQQNAELTIVTAEGDRVTISASQSVSVDAAVYDARGRLRGGVDGAFYERTASSSIAVQVEGHLNADEIEDIAKVVKELAKIADGHGQGRRMQAARRLMSSDLDTLASVNAEFSAWQQIEMARLAVASPVRGPLAAALPAAPPPVEPSAPQPSPMPDLSNTTVASAE